MAQDVVCGMEVNERDAESKGLISQHQNQAYYFCSADCKQQFDQNPQRYLAPRSQKAQQQSDQRQIG